MKKKTAIEQLKGKLDEAKNLIRELEQLYEDALVEKEIEEGLWDVEDVSRFLKCSKSSVYTAYQSGKLPCRQTIGGIRFDPDVVRNHSINTPLAG
jgi:AraC-like DNA-binding protein